MALQEPLLGSTAPSARSARVVLVACDLARLPQLGPDAEVRRLDELAKAPELAEAVEGLVVRSGLRVDDDFLERFPRLAFVLRAGSGIDNIDLDALQRRNVQLKSCPGATSAAVAELAWIGASALARKIAYSFAATSRRQWRKSTTVGESISDLSVAIWGGGPVGRAVYAAAPEPRRCRFARWPSLPTDLPSEHPEVLLARSDLHVVCLPSRPSTRRFFSRERLDAVADRRPYLVNVARADTVDLDEAVRRLQRDELRGVHIDPLDEQDVERAAAALTAREPVNLLVTQHLGAQRGDVMDDVARWVEDEARALLAEAG